MKSELKECLKKLRPKSSPSEAPKAFRALIGEISKMETRITRIEKKNKHRK